MDKEEYTDEITKFKVFEKFVTKEINKFIVSINSDTNIIKKRKYYIFKFYIDVDLIFVYGSFNKYDETDYKPLDDLDDMIGGEEEEEENSTRDPEDIINNTDYKIL